MLEKYSELMDARLRVLVPNFSRSIGLSSEEEDLRQETFLLATQRLATWRQLEIAERSGDSISIQREITRCILSSLKHAGLRLARKNALAARNVETFATECKSIFSSVEHHPSSVKEPFRMPSDARRALALAALRIATNARAINAGDAAIIQERIADGISQAEYGRRHGISREAVHQRETRAIPALRRAVDKTEVCP